MTLTIKETINLRIFALTNDFAKNSYQSLKDFRAMKKKNIAFFKFSTIDY